MLPRLVRWFAILEIELTFYSNRLRDLFEFKQKRLARDLFEDVPVFVINLDSRPDRWVKSQKNLKRMQIMSPIRVSAISDVYPKRGCSQSHLKVYQLFQASNQEVMLVCEDDIRFVGGIRAFVSAFQDYVIKEDINVFCVAGLVKKKGSSQSKHLLAVSDIQTTSCYFVKRNEGCVEELKVAALSSIRSLTTSRGVSVPIDKEWKKLQIGNKFVTSKKRLCVQYRGYSDIEKRKTWYPY
jgi:hypothetical protein